MSEKTVKLSTWQPTTRPDPESEEVQVYRQLIRESVFKICNETKKPASLLEIFWEVKRRIREKVDCGEWRWGFHGRRWIDRRVNEAATPKYYPDGVPKIVASTAGHYIPNPDLFKVNLDA